MSKRIRIDVNGTAAYARLLEDKAPIACEKLWKLLPYDGTALHSRLGGGAVYVHVDGLVDPTYKGPAFPAHRLPENFCSFLQTGTVNYVAPIGELFICYDQAQIRSPKGNEWAARIADFDGDAAALFAVLGEIQHKGAAKIRIVRA